MHLIRRQFPMALPTDIPDCFSHFESYWIGLEFDLFLVLPLHLGFRFWFRFCFSDPASAWLLLPNLKTKSGHVTRQRSLPQPETPPRETATNLRCCSTRTSAIDRTSKTGASIKRNMVFHLSQVMPPRKVTEPMPPPPSPPKWKRKRNQKAPFVRASSILTRPSTVRGPWHGSWLDSWHVGAGRQFACTGFIVFQRAKIKTKIKTKKSKKNHSNKNLQ